MNHWQQILNPRFDAADSPIRFFFRTDDGGWNDAALQRLVLQFAQREVPLDVALIPESVTEPLADWLRARLGPLLGVHQHGFAHVNHEPAGRKCEFGPSRAFTVQRADITRGWERLDRLLRGRLDPIFTPPWNRCTSETARALVERGFEALSRDVTATALAPSVRLRELPVAVDWMKHRVGDAPDVGAIARLIAERVGHRSPIGIMLHHAVMTDADFEALDSLLQLLRAHLATDCLRMYDAMRMAPQGIAA